MKPIYGTHRVIRGGGWNYGARDCRCVDRDSYNSHYHHNDLGLRLALGY